MNEKLDEMQRLYKVAVDAWIVAIRAEEALASPDPHSIAEVDKWAAAHFREKDLRSEAKQAKADYEDAIRREFFGF